MTQESVKTDLLEIIKPYLPEEIQLTEVSEEKHLINDLKINSANLVDVVLDVEDEFDIRIENEDMERMLSVKAAMDIITEKLEAE